MKVLLFDTETTGLVGNSQLPVEAQPHVIEFYGHVCVFGPSQWETISELEFLCKPPVSLQDRKSVV